MTITISDRELSAALLAAVRDGVLVCDARGVVVELNDHFCRMSGYTCDELVGRSPPRWWASGEASSPVSSPPSRPGQERGFLVRKDGRRISVLMTRMPVGEGGAGGSVVVIADDGTGAASGAARERVERQRDDLAKLSHAVLSSHPAQIAVLDREGNIIAVNDAWRTFARENGGSDATGCLGTNYLNVCAAASGAYCDEAPAAVQGIGAVLRGESEVFQLEYPCHAPDKQRWFLLTAAPLRHRAGGAIVSHLDITERRLQEEELRRRAEELAGLAEQLVRSNEELDQFAYVTSHDLRAPLRGIANLASWIEEDLGPQVVTPETKKMLELLRGRVTRMEGLIDGILEYSRVGRSRQQAESVDVRMLLAETIDLISPPQAARVNIGQNMPTLKADRLRLQQVFMNLIGNALKHAGRPDPTVTITCADAGPRFVEFTVSDNGQGIDPQYHQKIFVIFQTLAARDKVEGSGVGLALVKKIVQSQGGRVRVESRPGEGATFSFTWPQDGTPAPPALSWSPYAQGV